MATLTYWLMKWLRGSRKENHQWEVDISGTDEYIINDKGTVFLINILQIYVMRLISMY